jgi:hypothetical protein
MELLVIIVLLDFYSAFFTHWWFLDEWLDPLLWFRLKFRLLGGLMLFLLLFKVKHSFLLLFQLFFWHARLFDFGDLSVLRGVLLLCLFWLIVKRRRLILCLLLNILSCVFTFLWNHFLNHRFLGGLGGLSWPEVDFHFFALKLFAFGWHILNDL